MAKIAWDAIAELAISTATERGLSEEHIKRLKFEISEIEKQSTTIIWENCYNNNSKFNRNPNMLLLPWVLGMLVDDANTDPLSTRKLPVLNTIRASKVNEYFAQHKAIPPDFIKDQDMPDIDLDCLPTARDPIKLFAMEKYGQNINDGYGPVCSVGTWQTYKFKSAMIDVCAALGTISKDVIIQLTTSLPDEVDDLKENGISICKGKIKDVETNIEKECGHKHSQEACPKCNSSDTEGPTIGKLLKEHKALEEFNNTNSHVVNYAIRIIGRIRNMGMHAGAIIIADRSLYGNIPMARSGKKSYWVSMWSEGRNTQLSKLGYLKWDILGLKTLQFIYNCCKLIELNRGITFGEKTTEITLESQPHMSGWDDIDPIEGRAGHFYDSDGNKHDILLNDEKALELANSQMVDGVFQFDTDLAKSILANGVRNFNDLMLFNAMGHPGPMQSIPEAVENRDDQSQSWKKKLDKKFLAVLEDTYGVICFHEDTLISMADGSHKAIKNVQAGDLVHSVDYQTRKVNVNKVECCGPTIFGDGLKITLENGYSVIVTPSHRMLAESGYVKAKDLAINDLLAIPSGLPQQHPSLFPDVSWLGTETDVAYLVGQLIGDGLLTSTGVQLCTGTTEHTDKIEEWLKERLPKLRVYRRFRLRAWYLQLSYNEQVPFDNSVFLPFVDTAAWWIDAYSKASGDHIARYLGKSTWWVYKQLRLHTKLNAGYRRPPKTRFHAMLEELGIKGKNCYNKRIPTQIMIASRDIRGAFLAGLIDSDGCLAVNKRGTQICHITTVSPWLLEDLARLGKTDGITSNIYKHRIFYWNSLALYDLVSPHLVLKKFTGKLTAGNQLSWITRHKVKEHQIKIGLSNRAMAKSYGVSAATLSHVDRPLIRSKVFAETPLDVGDLQYLKIRTIEPVYDIQFWDLAVAGDHSLVANGIVAHNCFQEQLQSLWQNIAGFTAPDAQEARKAVAKKWTHKLAPIKEKWLKGASPIIGEKDADQWWSKMVTFGRYAFNRCLDKDTLFTNTNTNETLTIEQWKERMNEDIDFAAADDNNNIITDKCVNIHDTGMQEIFEIVFSNGQVEHATALHQFMCTDGEYHTVREIIDKGLDVVQATPFAERHMSEI